MRCIENMFLLFMIILYVALLVSFSNVLFAQALLQGVLWGVIALVLIVFIIEGLMYIKEKKFTMIANKTLLLKTIFILKVIAFSMALNLAPNELTFLVVKGLYNLLLLKTLIDWIPKEEGMK